MNFNLSRWLLVFSVIAITGCSNFSNLTLASPDVFSVPDIKNEELLENSLTVQGTVEKIIPLLDSSLYLLTGNNQSIWVITHTSPPTKSQLVTINALLKKEKIIIEGEEKSEFYLQEIDRIPQE